MPLTHDAGKDFVLEFVLNEGHTMKATHISKTAIVLQNGPTAGGAFTYEGNVLASLSKLPNHPEFIVLCPPSTTESVQESFPMFTVVPYTCGLVAKLFIAIRGSLSGYYLLKSVGMRYGKFEKSLRRNGDGLAYFLSPNPISLDLVDTAMIHTVWDLGNRDVPEYPEIAGDRHYEEREFFYSRILPKSFRVVVDTPRTASRINDIYKVANDRIIVGGLAPARSKSTTSSENFTLIKTFGRYFLYPAQFWLHKRHSLLSEAFAQFLKSHPSVNLVFTGSDKGNMSHIKDLVNKLGIQKNVHFLGFVSDELLTELMENTVSLMFPCQLGPSNLPPLEAAQLGTRSVVSNIHYDPALDHPLIRQLSDQSISAWVDAMSIQISNDETKNIAKEVSNPDIAHLVSGSIAQYWKIRDEWTNSLSDPYVRL